MSILLNNDLIVEILLVGSSVSGVPQTFATLI